MRRFQPYAVAAGLTVVAGTVVRGVVVRDRGSLWFDELFTAHAVSQPWQHMLSTLAGDTHPPSYYVVLKLWVRVFGAHDETTLRSLSAAVGVLALVLVAWLGPRAVGRPVAFLWLVLLACSPILVTYSAEARMYSLLSMLACTLVLAAAAIHLERPSPRAWTATLVLSAAAMSTVHMFGMVTALVTAVVFGSVAVSRRRTFTAAAPWLWSAVAAIVTYTAWLAVNWSHMTDAVRAVGWIPTPDRAALALTVVELVGGVALLTALATASFVSIAVRTVVPGGEAPGHGEVAALSLAVVVLTLLLTWIGSQWFSLWQTRYFIGLVPFLTLASAIAIAGLASRTSTRRGRLGLLTGSAATLVAIAVLTGQLSYVEEDWRGAAASLLSLDAPPDVPILTRDMERSAWPVYTDTLAESVSPGHTAMPESRFVGVTDGESLSDATAGRPRVLWVQAHLPMPQWVSETFTAQGFACTAETFTGNAALLDCRR